MWYKIVLLLFVSFNVSAKTAFKAQIAPKSGGNDSTQVRDFNNVINGAETKINLFVSCFGTNGVSAPNPLSPTSTVTAHFTFTDSGGAAVTKTVTFPATVAKSNNTRTYSPGLTVMDIAVSDTTFFTSWGGKGQSLQLVSAGLYKAPVQPDGSYLEADRQRVVSSVWFEQTINQVTSGICPIGCLPTNPYPGMDGPITAVVETSYSADGSTVDMNIRFPGQAGFCGAYY